MKLRRILFAWITSLLILLPTQIAAREIPGDLLVQVFFKPEAQRLRILLRIPLKAIPDVRWPESKSSELEISRADDQLREAATKLSSKIAIFETDRRLDPPRLAAVIASLPSDRSFDGFEQALIHVTGPRLSDDSGLPTQQALLDALFEYDIQSQASAFSIRADFADLATTTNTTLRVLSADRPERVFSLRYVGRNDPGLVRLDPRLFQAARRFVVDGSSEMFDGIDHLLFLFCLIVPFRRLRPVALIVTSFIVAQSITLIASAYDVAPDSLWFSPLIGTLIAISLVYVALENIISPVFERRWIIAFAFGLVHGFGYSFAFRDSLQFAGSHVLTSLVSFDVGVAFGQILFLGAFVLLLRTMFRFVDERVGTIILSALVAHAAWHWLTERFALFRRYPIQTPVFDAAFFAALVRGMMLAVIVAFVAWLLFGVFGQRRSSTSSNISSTL
jgi:uncharacterized membrane-anchored protein YitT (DUF2179 family)